MNYLVATTKSWNVANFKQLKQKYKSQSWFIITDKKDFTLEKVKKINPRYIFFPHWSWIIPADIYGNFECVVFHMTDLPYGRGGSPLQNLIVRRHKNTKVSALRVVKDLDAGPVYFKKNLSLSGNASDILKRCSKIVFEMIPIFVKRQPKPAAQQGTIVSFKRRKPEDGNLAPLADLATVYDFIRMLDAEGYPHAFLDTDKLRFKFQNVKLNNNQLTAIVNITKKI